MDCLVHYSAGVVGRVSLNKETASGDPAEGPTLLGQMSPSDAYASIRSVCQELRQVIHPDFYEAQSLPGESSGMHMSESLDSFERRMMAFEAARALALRLTRPDGSAIPTLQVLIEDFTPTAEERASLSPDDKRATGEFLLVAATMPAGTPSSRRAADRSP